jgi:hypothetical protein
MILNKMTLYFCLVTDYCVGLQYGVGVKMCAGNPVENGMQAFLAGSDHSIGAGCSYEVPENIYPLGMTAEQLSPYGVTG